MAWEKLEKCFLIFPEPKQAPLNALARSAGSQRRLAWRA